MAARPIIQQPRLTDSIFQLMPDEYIRFEYIDNPGCCCFSSTTTIVTNMRLISRVIKPAKICSKQTSSGEEYVSMMFLTDIHDIKQIHSAIPASRLPCWRQCLEIITCSCANPKIDWLNSCREVKNLPGDPSIIDRNNLEPSLIEKF